MGLTKNLGWLSKYITADSSGLIGIGITSPSEILDIRGSSQPTIKIRNNTASGGNYSQLLFEVANTFSGASSSYIRSVSTNTGNSSTDLSFGVNGNGGGSPFEAIHIFSSGNVYIGTTSADTGARLQLQGSNDILSLRSTDAASRSTMALVTNGYDWEVGARGSSNSPANSFYIYNIDNSAYRFIISQAGNVLIGTQADNGSKLQIEGGATFVGTTTLSYPDQGGARFKIVNSAGATSSGYGLIAGVAGTTQDGFSLYDYTNSATRLVVTRYGTLGIGGNEDVNNTYVDKISIGHLQGSYGWIQTWNATTLYLNKAGNAVYAGTQRIDNNSDERIKENIVPIENALNTVLLLQGKKYNMLDEDDILRYGFIAQEVQPHLSDFVTESNRTFEKDDVKIENLLTLESSGAAWAALLVEAIKELTERIKTLENK